MEARSGHNAISFLEGYEEGKKAGIMEAKIEVRGDKIGKRANDWYIRVVCPECGKERWVLKWKLKLPSFTGLCWVCSARKNTNRAVAIGDKHPRWNGGQTVSRGYVYILNDKHPACTSKGYVKRARLVLEKRLSRHLLPNHIPHHLNGIKDDDRSSNLIELSKSQHTMLHAFERRLIANAKSLGIKEVVEWQRRHIYPPRTMGDEAQWQAKLKEWGIDNG